MPYRRTIAVVSRRDEIEHIVLHEWMAWNTLYIENCRVMTTIHVLSDYPHADEN